MTRVKRGKISIKRRRNVLKQTKGYRHARKSKERAAREAIVHAGKYAFAHRRDKKGDFRTLWQVRINAALRPRGLSYSVFMGLLKKRDVRINRKVLAELAMHRPVTLDRLVKEVTA